MKKQTITLLASAAIASGFLVQTGKVSASEQVKVEQESRDGLAQIEQNINLNQDKLRQLHEKSDQLEEDLAKLKQAEKENADELEGIFKKSKETSDKLTTLKEKEDVAGKDELEAEKKKIEQIKTNTDQEVEKINTEITQRETAFHSKIKNEKDYFRELAKKTIDDKQIFDKYQAESRWLYMTSPDYYALNEKVKGIEGNIETYQYSIEQLNALLTNQSVSDSLKQEISETIKDIQAKLTDEINALPTAKKAFEKAREEYGIHYKVHPDVLTYPILTELRAIRVKDDQNRYGYKNAVMYLNKKSDHLQTIARLNQKILSEIEEKLASVSSESHQEEINSLTKRQQELKQKEDELTQTKQEIKQKASQLLHEQAINQKQIEQVQLKISELEKSKADFTEKQNQIAKDKQTQTDHVQKPALNNEQIFEQDNENIIASQVVSPINQNQQQGVETSESTVKKVNNSKKKTKGRLQIKIKGKWFTYHSHLSKKLSKKTVKARAKATVISKKAFIANARGKKLKQIKLGKKVKIYAIKRMKQKIWVKIGFNKWINIKYLTVN